MVVSRRKILRVFVWILVSKQPAADLDVPIEICKQMGVIDDGGLDLFQICVGVGALVAAHS